MSIMSNPSSYALLVMKLLKIGTNQFTNSLELRHFDSSQIVLLENNLENVKSYSDLVRKKDN